MYVEHVCLVSGGPSSESGLSGYLIRAIKQGGGGRFERLAQGFAGFWCMVRVVWEARVGD